MTVKNANVVHNQINSVRYLSIMQMTFRTIFFERLKNLKWKVIIAFQTEQNRHTWSASWRTSAWMWENISLQSCPNNANDLLVNNKWFIGSVVTESWHCVNIYQIASVFYDWKSALLRSSCMSSSVKKVTRKKVDGFLAAASSPGREFPTVSHSRQLV